MDARSRQQSNTRQAPTLILVWLDASSDDKKNKDSIDTISKLREVVNTVYTFTNADECVNFIDDSDGKETIMISSGAFGQTIVPIIHDKPQVNSIYIFCGNKSRHIRWAQQWPKIKGIFTDIKPICEALEQTVQECEQNSISMSFVATGNDTPSKNLDRLDPSFMYTQILKEILLTIDFEQRHIQDFISFCREQFCDNTMQLKTVDKLEREYHKHTPIWWYTCESFLYSMLNRALRIMEVDVIIRMGFFLCDLHKHIVQLHAEQFGGHHHSNSFIVYRGQGLSQTDFSNLLKAKGGLLSFNNFLTTHKDRQVSLMFAESAMNNPNHVGILFVMKIDPSIASTPFANVRDVSCFSNEEEMLFSMHTIFRIGQIKQMDDKNRLWQVELALTNDTDPQLHALTEIIRKETFPNENGWFRLSELLIKLGHFNNARQICHILLDQETNEREKARIYHQLGRICDHEGQYTEAITYYEKALEIQQKTLSPNHPDLATTYSNIGSVYEKMGEYSKALSYDEKALQIQQRNLPSNHSTLATTYRNISSVYEKMGEYSKALSYNEKALEIQQRNLPPNHPDLATTYRNIGLIYEKMSEYSKALSYDEKALEIQQKCLPPNHPDLASTYSNIGLVYEKMDEYSKALSFYERALEIGQYSLPTNHPHVQKYKKDVESLKKKM